MYIYRNTNIDYNDYSLLSTYTDIELQQYIRHIKRILKYKLFIYLTIYNNIYSNTGP